MEDAAFLNQWLEHDASVAECAELRERLEMSRAAKKKQIESIKARMTRRESFRCVGTQRKTCWSRSAQ